MSALSDWLLTIKGATVAGTSSKWAMVIVAWGIILIGAAFSLEESSENNKLVDKPIVDNVSNLKSQEMVQPIMPAMVQNGKAIRDPFKAPPEYQEQVLTQLPSPGGNSVRGLTSSNLSSVKPAGTPKDSLPVLVGVVSRSERRVAILKFKDFSRACEVSNSIGPYQLVDIGEESAILLGPDGQQVLTLGR